jgi:hypothetical protein
VQRGKRKLKERGREEEEEVTSQKSLDTRLDIPASDIRYSRARHWSSDWNLPSRI